MVDIAPMTASLPGPRSFWDFVWVKNTSSGRCHLVTRLLDQITTGWRDPSDIYQKTDGPTRNAATGKNVDMYQELFDGPTVSHVVFTVATNLIELSLKKKRKKKRKTRKDLAPENCCWYQQDTSTGEWSNNSFFNSATRLSCDFLHPEWYCSAFNLCSRWELITVDFWQGLLANTLNLLFLIPKTETRLAFSGGFFWHCDVRRVYNVWHVWADALTTVPHVSNNVCESVTPWATAQSALFVIYGSTGHHNSRIVTVYHKNANDFKKAWY